MKRQGLLSRSAQFMLAWVPTKPTPIPADPEKDLDQLLLLTSSWRTVGGRIDSLRSLGHMLLLTEP